MLRVGDAGHTLFGPSNGTPSPETIATGIRNGDNARRLAHCWNCHQELLEACNKALDELGRLLAAKATDQVQQYIDVDTLQAHTTLSLAIQKATQATGKE